MSVLSKIRNRAGLLVAIIGLALASFVIGDIFTTGYYGALLCVISIYLRYAILSVVQYSISKFI